MKILIISSYLPYPLYSGGHVRLYNLIRELSKNHEITLICEKRFNQKEKDIEEVERICKKVITVERKKQWSIANILKSIFSRNSFLVIGHTNKKMQVKIKEELENNTFDLIHVETFYVMQNLPVTNLPVVLAEHNIEHQIYLRFVNKLPTIFRPFLALDIFKLKREEEDAWRKATKLVAVSTDDKNVMEKKELNATIVANGVDIEKFEFKPKAENLKPKKILFIGDFKWIQNRDSVNWIIKEIFPLIKNQINAKLWVVGRGIPDSVRRLINDPDVIFDEESSGKPTEEIFHEADVLLAPIRVGGGTSYKILESMSCGTPVITTKMSAEAIEAVNNKDIIVGEIATELAEKTLSILQNSEQYEKISKNGRELIEQKYTWGKIAKDLDNVYKSLI